MKAIVQTGYGLPDVFELREIEKPVVDDDGVLVRVRAASVNALDWHLMRGIPSIIRLTTGLRRPKSPVPGVNVAGHVEAVGRNVTRFKPGEEVFGMRSGAFAEYVAGKERNFVPKPVGFTFEQAAAVPVAGETALQGLRDKGQIRPGQKVLVNGASGGDVRRAGRQVVWSDRDGRPQREKRRHGPIHRRGPDNRLHPGGFRPGRGAVRPLFDVAGNHSCSDCRRVLTPNGTHVVAGQSSRGKPSILPLLLAPVPSRFRRQKLVTFIAKHSNADLVALKELMEAGKLTPVIDRPFPLRDVPEAIRYLGEGHPRAKIVITV